jgi:hypothetical protein
MKNTITWAQAKGIMDENLKAVCAIFCTTAQAFGMTEEQATDFIINNTEGLVAVSQQLFEKVTDILEIEKVEAPTTADQLIDLLEKAQNISLRA